MITLKHGDYVRLATWGYDYATVGTVRGFFEGRDPGAMELRAKSTGQPLAWTSYAGSTLTNSQTHYANHKARVSSAQIVGNGSQVEIEGRQYVVAVVRGNEREPRNSDPIKFQPL